MPDSQRSVARRRVPRVKLVAPEPPPRLVSRVRLLTMLDRGQDAGTTFVCAPAGAGKTLLLTEWVSRNGSIDTAWVSLDADDNDDSRFWSALLDALATCPSIPADSPIRTLAVPAYPSADAGFLAEVINALDDLPALVRLVLDDVHEVTAAEPLHGLEALLRHQPAGLRLVLSSRHELPLPLARLRLDDQLAEVRTDELRFSVPEAKALLEAAEVQLRPDQLELLVNRTEGWAAGLRLAAVSLRESDDPDRFLADFAENDRAIAEYLIDEVLSRLPEDMREFLRTISICDQVNAGLAGALSGRSDAGAMLDALELKTSLAVRVGAKRQWYRVHALVRAHLLADLSRQSPGHAAALHARAADWFAAAGKPVGALAHAGQANDPDRVLALLRDQAVVLTLAGEHDVLRRALTAVGEDLIAGDSQLALVSAFLHLEVGEPDIAELQLAHAEAAWPARPSAELDTLRALAHSRRAQVGGDVEEMVQTTEELGAAGVLDALSLLHRGTALLASGQRGPAREALEAALAAARDSGQDYVETQCLTVLAGAAGVEGDVRRLYELASEADRQNLAHGWQHTIEGGSACMMLGYAAFLRGELAECTRQVNRAAAVLNADGASAVNPSLQIVVGTLLGAAQFELGDRAAGLRQIRDTRLAGGDARFSAQQLALCAVLEHRAAVLLGWGDAAREVLTWSQTTIPGTGEIALMKARGQLALGRNGPAGNLLRPLLAGTVAPVLPWTVIEAALVETLVAVREDESARARTALARALSLAESMDAPYPLVCAEADVIEVLTRQLGSLGGLEPFAGRVLALRRSLHAPPVPVPLTERELGVLRLLPTLRSFEEIAQDLTVSLNTVKTHVRAIYTKLGVRRRRDAVAVAIERGLLEATDAGASADVGIGARR